MVVVLVVVAVVDPVDDLPYISDKYQNHHENHNTRNRIQSLVLISSVAVNIKRVYIDSDIIC